MNDQQFLALKNALIFGFSMLVTCPIVVNCPLSIRCIPPFFLSTKYSSPFSNCHVTKWCYIKVPVLSVCFWLNFFIITYSFSSELIVLSLATTWEFANMWKLLWTVKWLWHEFDPVLYLFSSCLFLPNCGSVVSVV